MLSLLLTWKPSNADVSVANLRHGRDFKIGLIEQTQERVLFKAMRNKDVTERFRFRNGETHSLYLKNPSSLGNLVKGCRKARANTVSASSHGQGLPRETDVRASTVPEHLP